MTEYIWNSMNYLVDKLGDATIYVLDEVKFWGEVATEFMEYDQSSSDKYFDEYRKDIRDQIQEIEECHQEIENEEQKQENEEQEEILDDENK